ncbi:MAG: hypothetical protein ACHQF2_04245 [Flavobacteriales bacterium]
MNLEKLFFPNRMKPFGTFGSTWHVTTHRGDTYSLSFMYTIDKRYKATITSKKTNEQKEYVSNKYDYDIVHFFNQITIREDVEPKTYHLNNVGDWFWGDQEIKLVCLK